MTSTSIDARGSGGIARRRAGQLVSGILFLLLAACSAAPRPADAPLETARAALPPDTDWSDDIVYFAIVDRFADGDPANNVNVDTQEKGTFHGGDFRGLREHLGEIADLGVTAIWITPVVRNIDGFVTGAGFPDWAYHGYWADDFTTTDPRFGSEQELRALVDETHRRGIKVLLDVVYNHAGYNSRYLTNPATRAWLRSNETGSCGDNDITSCVAGLPDFKTEIPEVADFLLTNQIAMARRAGVDGFRLDTVKHLDHPFWREHRARTRQQLAPHFFLLGEVWGGDAEVLDPWFAGDEMDAGFDFSFQGSALGWVQGRGRTIAFDRYLKSRAKVRPRYLLAHFLSSHDVTTGLSILEGDKQLFRLAALLQMTSSGLPVIYYGEEVGRLGGAWPDNRSDMPWGDRNILPGRGKPRDESLRADYTKLIGIRRSHPALTRGTYGTLSTDGDVLVFLREDAASGDAVVVAVNRGEQPAERSVQLPAAWAGRKLRDVWNDEAVSSSGKVISFPVPGTGARILVTEGP